MYSGKSNHQLRFFNFWLALGIALVVMVIYLSLTSKPPDIIGLALNDKLAHLLAYTVLMGWFGQLFTKRTQLLWFVVGFALLGIALEFAQAMGRHRHFEYADMAANITGVLIGLVLTTTILKDSLQWIEKKLILH